MPEQDGIYGRMEKKDGHQRHHFPPKIVYKLRDEQGKKLFEPTVHLSCAIRMPEEIHQGLGSSNMSKQMKKDLEQIAREKGFRAVKAWGIWEVRREYGRTYNKEFLESLKEGRKLEAERGWTRSIEGEKALKEAQRAERTAEQAEKKVAEARQEISRLEATAKHLEQRAERESEKVRAQGFLSLASAFSKELSEAQKQAVQAKAQAEQARQSKGAEQARVRAEEARQQARQSLSQAARVEQEAKREVEQMRDFEKGRKLEHSLRPQERHPENEQKKVTHSHQRHEFLSSAAPTPGRVQKGTHDFSSSREEEKSYTQKYIERLKRRGEPVSPQLQEFANNQQKQGRERSEAQKYKALHLEETPEKKNVVVRKLEQGRHL